MAIERQNTGPKRMRTRKREKKDSDIKRLKERERLKRVGGDKERARKIDRESSGFCPSSL